MEIGSEFCYEESHDSNHSCLKRFQSMGNLALTASGRGAIALLLREVVPKNKIAFLPAYLCSSVLLPFLQQGYQCYFYEIKQDFTPAIKSIEFKEAPGIFYHMGYYGFPTNEGLKNTIDCLEYHGTIVIEDITQTLFTDWPRWDRNNYCVASIRKWFGIPCGGMLVSNEDFIRSELVINSQYTRIREEALKTKALYEHTQILSHKLDYQKLFLNAEELMEEDNGEWAMDENSKSILSGIEVEKLMKKRQKNFHRLDQKLNKVSAINNQWKTSMSRICPMFYPIYVENPKELQKKLSKEKIYCPIHWPKPSQITQCYESTDMIYEHILSIPCDQRYDSNHMDRIIDVLDKLWA